MFLIKGKIVTPFQVINEGKILIDKDKIVQVGRIKEFPSSTKIFNIPESIIVPGFIDIHIHGLGKYNTKGKASIIGMSRLEPCYGTTGFVPSLGDATHKECLQFLEDIKEVIEYQPPRGAKVLGAHLEGPYVNSDMKGGLDEKYLRLPKPEEYQELIGVAGKDLRIMTLSPELPDAIDLIKFLRRNGTIVSLGHSMAKENDLREAIKAGLTHVCHLYNAFPLPKQRKLGVKEPTLADICLSTDGLTIEIICDGIHVHPVMIRLAIKATGLKNIIAITDSRMGTGLAEGIYEMSDGRRFFTEKGGVPRLVNDKKIIVGSILTMNYALKNLAEKCGLSLFQACQLTSLNPAKIMGIDKITGSIEVGKKADVVVLDGNFECLATFIEGRLVYQRNNES